MDEQEVRGGCFEGIKSKLVQDVVSCRSRDNGQTGSAWMSKW